MKPQIKNPASTRIYDKQKKALKARGYKNTSHALYSLVVKEVGDI